MPILLKIEKDLLVTHNISDSLSLYLVFPSCGLTSPNSRATPACVAIPPLLLFLKQTIIIIQTNNISHSKTHGFIQGEGFLVSSMRPDIFLRNKLCMCFSSMSLSFTLPLASTWQNYVIVQHCNTTVVDTCCCCWFPLVIL